MGSSEDLDVIILTILFIGAVLFIRNLLKEKGSPPSEGTKSPPPRPAAPEPRRAMPMPEAEPELTAPEIAQPAAPDALSQRQAGGPVVGVYVVVTTGDEMAQMVAMSLSNQFKAQGKDVKVLLCGAGGDLALASHKGTIFPPLEKSPKMMLQNLLNNGVKVEICPFYLPHKGKSQAELTPGIGVAKPPEVAGGLLQPGYKLFTF